MGRVESTTALSRGRQRVGCRRLGLPTPSIGVVIWLIVRTPGPADTCLKQPSSGQGRVGRPPTRALAPGAVVLALVVVLAVGGSHSAQDSPEAATREPLTGTQPAQASKPASVPTKVSTGSAAAPKPAPKAVRTTMQKATGRRADGSAYPLPYSGEGTFSVADQTRRARPGTVPVVRFNVRVEKDLRIDPDEAALLVASILQSKRSWSEVRFHLVGRGEQADVHAYIATPATTDQLCAPLLTEGKVSCQNGSRVVLNAARWVRGAKAYGADTISYRQYLVNHEFGHTLGRRHVSCPGRGRRAPVMMQQTKGLTGCQPNPWPETAA